MSELQINTTQNVNLTFTAASIGERILAYLADYLIKVAYVATFGYIIFDFFGLWNVVSSMDDWSMIASILIFLLPVLLYSLMCESLMEGQTFGKRILRIKVVKIDGFQASLPDYFIRWIFRIIDLNMLSGLIGIITIIVTSKSQRLGDITAGTSVISVRHKVSIDHTILEELGNQYKPTYPLVVRLSDNDARIIKETFERSKKDSDLQTLLRLRDKIVEVTGIQPVDKEIHTFIKTVLKDYNFYTQNM